MKKTIILLFAVLFNTIFVVKAQQMNGAGYTDGEKNCNPATNVKAVSENSNVTLTWNGPEILFFDDFESGNLNKWTLVDNDGDDENWRIQSCITETGYYLASSWSWDSGVLNPDNWMISPLVEGATTIRYFVATNDLYPDHYAIMASSTGNSVGDFTLIFEETVPTSKKSGEGTRSTTTTDNRGLSPWVERNITLPTGTKYVAFRHYNSSNNNYLYVDDVTISGDASTGNYSFTITKDGAEIATGITETTYTDTNVANGTYEYCVKVVYTNCTSEPACAAPVTVHNPATNVQAIVEGSNVSVTWDAPMKGRETLLGREYTYTITRDGDEIATGITETIYTDTDVPNGTYVYCVKVVYTGYTSDRACAASVIVLNCDPATNFQAIANGSTVNLTWDAPTEAGGDNNITITYGFEGNIEADGWDIHSYNTSDTWRQVGTIEYPSGNVYPHEGSSQMQCHWDNADQNEWLISPRFSLPAQANLNFWTYLTCGSTHGDHYYVKISIDNGFSWTELWDASTQPAGINHYDEAINISLAEYANQNIKLAWHALATGGLYYAWFVDDITISGVATEDYTYTITRDGVEIASGLTETNYTDENVTSGTHDYCVEVVYNSCTSAPVCATVVGIEDDAFSKIKVYPNPATDNITIECAENINKIEVFDVLGRKIISNENILNNTNVDITSLNNGIYFLIVHTENGNGEYKIIKQ